MNDISERQVGPRGCGYPVEGGCYIESIGGAGGMLPWFVPIEPPVSWHFFRGVMIVDGAFLLGQTESKDADYERRQLMQEFAQVFFGEHARLVEGHAESFARELNLVLDENGHGEDGNANTFEAAVARARESKPSLRRLAVHVRV